LPSRDWSWRALIRHWLPTGHFGCGHASFYIEVMSEPIFSVTANEPFRIAVPDSVLADLKARLHNTRWPDQMPGTEWEYGTELTAVQKLCTYWADDYDWRPAEASLNAWPQFKATVDGQTLHYAHIRSPHENALPLVLTHGWPGSIAEFLKVAAPLLGPVAHGGSAADAFHLVIPSILGYGFSGPTTVRGINVLHVSQSISALMAYLGYSRYGVQGGDWGSIISSGMGLLDPEHVVGVHVNMVMGRPTDPANPLVGVLPDEMAGLAFMKNFREHEVGYQEIQKTRPQTLAYGLTDSPAGLAGWILEKFRQWSDCDGDPFSIFSMDELCTNLMIYWVTGTINSSTRLYFETIGAGRAAAMPKIEVPVGCAVFPKELFQAPRVWAENQYNVQQWSKFNAGGHFAAMEQPEALVGDIQSFFRTVR
jgi:pimeloyl-ACP methyl ester carboxylesterase